MPKMLNQDMESFKQTVHGTFTFSAVRPDTLTEVKYTLATVVVDITGSVASFADELLNCLKTAAFACKESPQIDNILFRALTFNTKTYELHGFKPLASVDPDNDYHPFNPADMTALYDATYDAIGASIDYGETLVDQKYKVNAVCIICTDGDDNRSKISPADIADRIDKALKTEKIESITTILVGINAKDCLHRLEDFKSQAKLTHFIDAGDATAKKLAKLAQFISKSISSTSAKLGQGVAPSITF